MAQAHNNFGSNNDIENIAVVLKDFTDQKRILMERKYNSVLSESQRRFKINKKIIIKSNSNNVSLIIFKLLLSSLNKNLTLQDIENKKVIKVNNNNKIIYVIISEYLPNKLLKIEFISNQIWFEKMVCLKAINNEKTLLIYQEKVLGAKVIYGMLATLEKKRYINLQLTMFDYQILQLKYQLNLLSQGQMTKYQKNASKYQNKILRYQNFKLKRQ